MLLSLEQHLGYYHQSVPALCGDELLCVEGFHGRQLWIWISFTFFIHVNILNFSLFAASLPLRLFSFDRTIACLCFLSPYIFREWIALCHWALAKNSFLVGQMFQNVIFDRNQPAQWIQGKTLCANFFCSTAHTKGNHAVHKTKEPM